MGAVIGMLAAAALAVLSFLLHEAEMRVLAGVCLVAGLGFAAASVLDLASR